MRYQRRAHSGSRPEGLGHPRPTLHTAASYHAKYIEGGGATMNRLRRYIRLLKKETKAEAEA